MAYITGSFRDMPTIALRNVPHRSDVDVNQNAN